MQTPTQLSACLAELGIDRDLRVLTDWRQKRLLPQLRKLGLGRGQGSTYVWEEDVSEQAIAAHWLLGRYGRANTALLGLWFSGYAVRPEDARREWVSHLQHLRERRQKKAFHYKDGFFGLAQSWSRKLRQYPWSDKSHRDAVLDFMRDTVEWHYDDAERNDEDFQAQLAELLNGIRGSNSLLASSGFHEVVESVWNNIDIPKFFRNSQSSEFVGSMTDS